MIKYTPKYHSIAPPKTAGIQSPAPKAKPCPVANLRIYWENNDNSSQVTLTTYGTSSTPNCNDQRCRVLSPITWEVDNSTLKGCKFTGVWHFKMTYIGFQYHSLLVHCPC